MKNLNIANYFKNTKRFISETEREGKKAKIVSIERVYDTNIHDLWEALTTKDRIERWFAPISGQLQNGGRYKIEGNAEGTITNCNPPNKFSLTWEFGGAISWVEVFLIELNDESVQLRLNHIAHKSPHWDTYGPSAVGIGWELGLLGLMIYISSPSLPKINSDQWSTSPEGKNFIEKSSEGWYQASIDAGESEQWARTTADKCLAFYTGSQVDI